MTHSTTSRSFAQPDPDIPMEETPTIVIEHGHEHPTHQPLLDDSYEASSAAAARTLNAKPPGSFGGSEYEDTLDLFLSLGVDEQGHELADEDERVFGCDSSEYSESEYGEASEEPGSMSGGDECNLAPDAESNNPHDPIGAEVKLFLPFNMVPEPWASVIAAYRDAPHTHSGSVTRTEAVEKIQKELVLHTAIPSSWAYRYAINFVNHYDTSPTRLDAITAEQLSLQGLNRMLANMAAIAATSEFGREITAIADVWKSQVTPGGYPGGGEALIVEQQPVVLENGRLNVLAGDRVMAVEGLCVRSCFRVAAINDDAHNAGSKTLTLVNEITLQRGEHEFSVNGTLRLRKARLMLAPCTPAIETALTDDTRFILDRTEGAAYTCSTCPQEFSSAHKLKQHEETIHVDNRATISCDHNQCASVFQNVEGLTTHKKTVHA